MEGGVLVCNTKIMVPFPLDDLFLILILKLIWTQGTLHMEYYAENLKGIDHLTDADVKENNIKIDIKAI